VRDPRCRRFDALGHGRTSCISQGAELCGSVIGLREAAQQRPQQGEQR